MARGIRDDAVDHLSAGDQRVDPEELSARVDAAIAVAVQYQPGVIGQQPAGAGAYAVGVVVEEHGAVRAAYPYGFDAVAVEVDGQGVARGGGQSATPKVAYLIPYAGCRVCAALSIEL